MRNFKPMNRQGGWIQFAALAISAVSAVAGFAGSQKASKAAKKQAKEEERLEKLATKEKVRRLDIEERSARGETMALYAASGVQTGGPTTGLVLSEQAREFAKQKQFTQQVGATKAQAARTEGKATADAYRYSGYANVASSISNMFTTYLMTKP